jgi:hypothetical protein
VSGSLNFVSGTFGNVGASTFTLNFLSSGNSPISLNVLSDNSLSFEGSSGQLLSISNNLSTGFIYSINNISGLPLLRANANGNISMGEFVGNVGVGTSTPQFKFHVIGDANVTGGFGVSGLANISGGLGVTGHTNLSSTLIVQGNLGVVSGLGVTGSSLFRSSVIVQSGGLGVTGGIVVTQGGLGVTGATVLRSTLSVLGTASFATINQGTWNGSTIGIAYGGTGLGSSGTANQFLGMSNDSTSLEYKTLIAGSNVTILNSTNSITISAATGGGSGSGTVNSGLITQVAYYAVGGTSVSGTSNLTVGSSGVGVSFNTQSTSSSTGALIVLGGFGVSGNVNVGTGLTVLGTVHAASNTNSTSSTSGALIITGGIGVSGRIWAGSGISSQGGGTFTGALSASSLTLATALPITSGGTGIGTSGTANQILGMSSTTSGLEYKTLTAGSNISISHGAGTVTLNVVGAGISSLNGLTNSTQAFTTGTSGTNFNIVSIGSTHTFNIPVAGSGSSGIITTQSQTIAGAKTFSSALNISDSTNSTDSSTGALIVTGGVGIGKSVSIGGTLTIGSDLRSPSFVTRKLTTVTLGATINDYVQFLTITGGLNGGYNLLISINNNLAGTNIQTNKIYAISGNYGSSPDWKVVSPISEQASNSQSGAWELLILELQGNLVLRLRNKIGFVGTSTNSINIYNLDGNNTLTFTQSNTTGTDATAYTLSGGSPLMIIGANTQVGQGQVAIATPYAYSSTTALTVGGSAAITGSTASISTTSGALIVTGGVGISGNLNVGTGLTVLGAMHVASNTNSTSSTSGALVVTGGIGVSGRIFGGTGLSILGGATFNSTVTINDASILNSTLYIGGATIIQSGGLGVTGGIIISQGGLGVTGATVLRSTLSVLGTASFATINQGTWNGSTIGLSYGGTGLGTTGTDNQLLGMSNNSTSLEYKTLIAGSNISILNSTNSITISATSGGGGSGTVNSGLISQVAYYAVGGTSVSGTANMTIGSSGVGISFATQSTSSTSGALIVFGGIGVSGNLNVGTGLTVLGTIHAASNVNSTSSTSGSVVITGGIGVSGRIWAGSGISSQGGGTFTGALSASSLTLSTALPITSGGTGIGTSGTINQILGMSSTTSGLEYKTLTAGSNISISHGAGTVTLNVVGAGISSLNGLTNSAQTFTTGTSGTEFNIVSIGSTHTFNLPAAGSGSSGVITTGTQTIAGTKTFTGNALFTSVTNSTSSTSGAVQIVGGLGVSGNLYVGTGLSIAGSVTLRSGIASTGGAPIYMTSGTNLTSPTPGAIEFDGSYLYFTPTTVRKQISNIALSGSAPTGASAGDFWWDAESGVLKIYYDSYWVETTGTNVYTAISEQVLSINDTTNSTSSTSGAVVVAGGIGVSGNLNIGSGLGVSGLTTLTYTSERLNTKTSATGTVTHDLTTGSIFYHSSISNNFTANITNVPVTNDRAIGVTLVLSQGGTPYMSTALQIDGSAQTIKWVNNVTPSGAANKVDIVGFSLIRTGSAWTVLGQYSTYG